MARSEKERLKRCRARRASVSLAVFAACMPVSWLAACDEGPRSAAGDFRPADESRRAGASEWVLEAVEESAQLGEPGPVFDAMADWEDNGAALGHAEPYFAWLQWRLLQDALQGDLFRVDARTGVVSLRLNQLHMRQYENRYWFVVRLSQPALSNRRDVVGALPPRLVWPWHGYEVGPPGPPGDPWGRLILISDVLAGEVVALDVYTLPIDERYATADVVEEAIQNWHAHGPVHAFRLLVPVVVGEPGQVQAPRPRPE